MERLAGVVGPEQPHHETQRANRRQKTSSNAADPSAPPSPATSQNEGRNEYAVPGFPV